MHSFTRKFALYLLRFFCSVLFILISGQVLAGVSILDSYRLGFEVRLDDSSQFENLKHPNNDFGVFYFIYLVKITI